MNLCRAGGHVGGGGRLIRADLRGSSDTPPLKIPPRAVFGRHSRRQRADEARQVGLKGVELLLDSNARVRDVVWALKLSRDWFAVVSAVVQVGATSRCRYDQEPLCRDACAMRLLHHHARASPMRRTCCDPASVT